MLETVRSGEERAVTSQDIMEKERVGRERWPVARRAQGQRGSAHPEGHLGPWLLDHESQIDLPIPRQLETEDASAAWLTR